MFFKISVTSLALVQMAPAGQVYTHTLVPHSAPLLNFAQQHSGNRRRVCLCFSPDLAAGRVLAEALASTQPQLSALLGFEECPSPGPEPFPGSWSGPDFSCTAYPLEVCGAESWWVGAGGPAGGGGDGAVAAESVLASSVAKGQWEACKSRAAIRM